jgi:insertion element IS1 protein InsB
LLLEKIPLAGIARVTGVSEKWLQDYVNDKYNNISQKIEVSDKPKGQLTIQCDEMRCAELAEVWSFVGNKDEKHWVWLAIDASTREIVGAHIGDRSQDGAQALWNSLPPVYRQCAVCYTDYFDKLSTSFGMPIRVFFHRKDTKLLAKNRARPVILNG